MLGEARDPLSKQIKLFNWDNLFHHSVLLDPGFEVKYLDGEDGWAQWDLAIKLQDLEKLS